MRFHVRDWAPGTATQCPTPRSRPRPALSHHCSIQAPAVGLPGRHGDRPARQHAGNGCGPCPIDHDVWPDFRRAFQSGRNAGLCAAPRNITQAGRRLCRCTDGWRALRLSVPRCLSFPKHAHEGPLKLRESLQQRTTQRRPGILPPERCCSRHVHWIPQRDTARHQRHRIARSAPCRIHRRG